MRFTPTWMIVVGFATAACRPGDVEVDPRVHVIDVEPLEVNPESLVFDSDHASVLLSRSPGDIIVSAQGVGFLREVADVYHREDNVVIDTLDAGLGDAIIEGEFSDHLELRGGPGADGKWDEVGGLVTIGSTTIISNGDAQLDLRRGSFEFTPDLDLDLEIHERELHSFAAVARGNLQAELDMELDVDGFITGRYDRALWESPPTYFYQQIGPVPVIEVVTVEVGVGAEIEASGTAHIELAGTASADLEVGATYNGQWQTVGDRQVMLVGTKQVIEGEAELAASVYLYAEIDIAFYGAAGPYMYIAPYLGVGSSTEDAPAWTPTVGVYGAWGGTIDIGSSSAVGFEAELFDVSREF